MQYSARRLLLRAEYVLHTLTMEISTGKTPSEQVSVEFGTLLLAVRANSFTGDSIAIGPDKFPFMHAFAITPSPEGLPSVASGISLPT